MTKYFGTIAILAAIVVVVACGGNDDSAGGNSENGGAASSVSNERIHSRYLISEFEVDNPAAAEKFGDKYVTFKAFVDKHDSNDEGTFVRLKSEPFATRYIYCYYDPAQQPEIPNIDFGSVVFMTGRIGVFEDIFLYVYDCSPATVETEGGGTKSGSTHLE